MALVGYLKYRVYVRVQIRGTGWGRCATVVHALQAAPRPQASDKPHGASIVHTDILAYVGNSVHATILTCQNAVHDHAPRRLRLRLNLSLSVLN